jgi:hypothetical protein
MIAVKPALEALVADLKAAGFTGSHYDPERVDPPAAVWVQRRSIRNLTLGGGGTLVVSLYLLAAASDDADDDILGKLDDALEGVLEMGLALSDEDGDAINLDAPVLLPGHAVPLPAYRLTVELEL